VNDHIYLAFRILLQRYRVRYRPLFVVVKETLRAWPTKGNRTRCSMRVPGTAPFPTLRRQGQEAGPGS
jgi:hypothetical protein